MLFLAETSLTLFVTLFLPGSLFSLFLISGRKSSLDIQLTDDGIDFIVQDFIKNPGRAKSRNVTLFFESDQLKQKDDEF